MRNSHQPKSERFKRQYFILLLLLPVLYYGLYLVFRKLPPDSPQLIAHRGGPKHAPENTLAAFRNAISIGSDWLEFDIQRTKDGVLVVIHDETVDRTTNGAGAVRDLTLEQIRALDAGNGEQVPTFEEVIALAKESNVGIMPEAKSPHLYPGIEAEMVQAIVDADYAAKTVIQSFDPQTLEAIKIANPDVQVCRLYGLWEFNIGEAQPGSADIVCPMAEMVLLFPWMIRQAHTEGYRAYVWFGAIEHPLVMRALLTFGADGLMVDNPLALAEILGR